MVSPHTAETSHLPHNRPGVDLRWPASLIWRDGEPDVVSIGLSDLKVAIAQGIDDFKAMPSHAVFLCLIYPIIGLVLCRLAFGYQMLPLIFPMIAGFALLGPIAAIGFYELSRRREQGLDSSPWHAFDVRHSPSFGAVVTLSLVMLAIFVLWLFTAQTIYRDIFGSAPPASLGQFIDQLFSTPAGHQLIVVGNAVGFLFAAVVMAISVVSIPLLIDRDVGAATAVRTSIRAVIANPVVMAAWGLIVAISLLLGAMPFLLGLTVVLPVLGHATWHLYRKVVVR